jgi:hypothetical protein
LRKHLLDTLSGADFHNLFTMQLKVLPPWLRARTWVKAMTQKHTLELTPRINKLG